MRNCTWNLAKLSSTGAYFDVIEANRLLNPVFPTGPRDSSVLSVSGFSFEESLGLILEAIIRFNLLLSIFCW